MVKVLQKVDPLVETQLQTLEKLLAAGDGAMASVVKGGDGQQRMLISLPINNPPLVSKSLKTLLVASTKGAVECEHVRINGQAVVLNVNAYIYAQDRLATRQKNEEKRAKKRADGQRVATRDLIDQPSKKTETE